eukprot:1665011-Amphidinium_carterae.2
MSAEGECLNHRDVLQQRVLHCPSHTSVPPKKSAKLSLPGLFEVLWDWKFVDCTQCPALTWGANPGPIDTESYYRPPPLIQDFFADLDRFVKPLSLILDRRTRD